MLNIQKFLAENENWREILSAAPYELKIEESDEAGWENLVLFKYNQIKSDFSNPIVREARGLILEKGTWKVVRMAFDKFFNFGEPNAAQIDWSTASATSKEDGSLISLYSYDGVWRIATNGKMNARKAPLENGGYSTFYDLAKAALELYGIDPNTDFNPNYTYTFELCSPFNMIVCKYDELQLFLTCVRDNETLEELDVEVAGVPRPQFYSLNSKEEYEALVENLGENREGIVIKDANGNRVKMKTLLYFQLHRMAGNGRLSLEQAVELVLANDTDEFLSYFPQYTEYIEKLRTTIDAGFAAVAQVSSIVAIWKEKNPYASRGEFAAYVKTLAFTPLYFVAYDGRDVVEYVKTLNAKKLINFFKLHDVMEA